MTRLPGGWRRRSVESLVVVAWLLGPALPLVSARPTHTVHEDGPGALTGAMMYLMKYGYMDTPHPNSKTANLLSQDGLKDYIMEFQAFAGLPRTGQLDNNTVTLMNTPRCGVKDIVGKGATARKKRYALQGSRWKTRDLTYKISKYPSNSKLKKKDVDNEMKRALEVWASVTGLTFQQRTSGKVHIEIRFEDGEHGDGDPFDGAGGTLAHAYFPVYGGDAHFDNGEYWTINSRKGTNLLQTAAHEFGHSLGLSHSDQYRALMAPFYRGYQDKIELDADDVTGIQMLYGEKKGTERPVTTEAPTSRTTEDTSIKFDEELCTNATIDSIVTLSDGNTFAFKGDSYWKLTNDAIAPGYPKSVLQDWQGLPRHVDAAFTWTNGKTYIFKGRHYWRYSSKAGLSLDPGYPKLISKGFEGIPDNVDAAVVWSGNGKIYFFKGSKYWRFDPDIRPPVKNTYPRPISNWEGIPDDVDDALQYSNGYTYFFKGGLYYRFDDRKFKVDDGDPPFPRPAGYWWFGCENSPSRGAYRDRANLLDLHDLDVLD